MSMLNGGTLTALSRLSARSPPSLAKPLTRAPLSTSQVVFARREGGGVSSRTRRQDKRGKKGSINEEDERGVNGAPGQMEEIEVLWEISKEPMPVLPKDEPDFWEGPQWNAFGFFMQYMWAFGVLFAIIACGVAVATYNDGATDFRETPAYKESVQSKELLDESESSNSDVFEGNPTEVAPALE
ncbi:hypothetical protein LUZ60_006274 [Juncus effusus]|nr:hypothetical protein LUZ60_006274 [Juncus effusus]